MEQLKRYFLREAKAGRLLTYQEVLSYSKSRRLKVSTRNVRDLRQEWMDTAIYRNGPLHPRIFQTISIPQLGLVQVDLAFYMGQERRVNNNHIGFLLCTAPATGLIHVMPIDDKSIPTFEAGLLRLMRASPFPVLHTIQSDQERSLTSEAFRESMFSKYRVRFQVLAKGSKAYVAERGIRTVKTKLSQTIKLNNTQRWINYLEPIVNHHNAQFAFGTKYRRNSINEYNFMDYLAAPQMDQQRRRPPGGGGPAFRTFALRLWRTAEIRGSPAGKEKKIGVSR